VSDQWSRAILDSTVRNIWQIHKSLLCLIRDLNISHFATLGLLWWSVSTLPTPGIQKSDFPVYKTLKWSYLTCSVLSHFGIFFHAIIIALLVLPLSLVHHDRVVLAINDKKILCTTFCLNICQQGYGKNILKMVLKTIKYFKHGIEFEYGVNWYGLKTIWYNVSWNFELALFYGTKY